MTASAPDAWKQTVLTIYDEMHFGQDSIFEGEQRLAARTAALIEQRHTGYFRPDRADAQPPPVRPKRRMSRGAVGAAAAIVLLVAIGLWRMASAGQLTICYSAGELTVLRGADAEAAWSKVVPQAADAMAQALDRAKRVRQEQPR